MNSFILPAFAKINLGLRVLRKREDGFHDLETVFLRVGWKDELNFEFEPSGVAESPGESVQISMTSSDPQLPVDETNLCIRAANAYVRACLLESPDGSEFTTASLWIHLQKEIPFGAGMGGGSSDAATVLRALAQSNDLPTLTDGKLHELASELGSDVPFFLASPAAFGSGRGEVLEEMAFPHQLEDTWMVIAVPNDRVSTPDAFRQVVPNEERESSVRSLIENLPITSWRDQVINDFEKSVFAKYPSVSQLKQGLYDHGAVFSLMSGSGSSVFGIFMTQQKAQAALNLLKKRWPSYAYWSGASREGV